MNVSDTVYVIYPYVMHIYILYLNFPPKVLHCLEGVVSPSTDRDGLKCQREEKREGEKNR